MKAVGAAAPRLTDAARERQFDKFFDYERGDRRLTCKSRRRIPECMAVSDRHAEWQGELRAPARHSLQHGHNTLVLKMFHVHRTGACAAAA